jgi:hypothetical protein
MAKHALLSPSSAERWMNCPGSVALTKDLPNTSSPYADEGTCAHFLASICLSEGQDASSFISREIVLTESGEHFACDTQEKPRYRLIVGDDFANYVQDYVDYVREVRDATKGVLHVEQRLSLEGVTGEEDSFGTSDAVIVTADELIVIDLKFGMGVQVNAEENPQLMIYGLASLDKYGLVQDFKNVRIAIHQPRLKHVSEAVYSLNEIEEFRKVVAGSSTNTQSPNAELVPSEDACRFCKAKATCPAISAKIAKEVEADFEDLTGEDHRELSNKLKSVDMIEGWCKAVRAEVESLLLAGVVVPDFKLVQGKKGHRQWTNASEVEAMFKSMRLKVDEMYDLKLISPTTAEKILKDSPKRWPKVQEFITQKEGGPSVAPISDKRPALDVTIAMQDYSSLV